VKQINQIQKKESKINESDIEKDWLIYKSQKENRWLKKHKGKKRKRWNNKYEKEF